MKVPGAFIDCHTSKNQMWRESSLLDCTTRLRVSSGNMLSWDLMSTCTQRGSGYIETQMSYTGIWKPRASIEI